MTGGTYWYSVSVIFVLSGAGGARFEALGAGLALGAAVLYATYVLAVAELGARVPALSLAALTSTGAAVALTLAGAVAGTLDLRFGAAGWACTLGVVATTVAALAAFAAGAARLGPSHASILAMLEPAIVALLAFALLGDRLGPLQLAGGALITAAALALQLPPRPRRRSSPRAGRRPR